MKVTLKQADADWFRLSVPSADGSIDLDMLCKMPLSNQICVVIMSYTF